ncbi:MAG TPA: hypothetical protein VM598_12365, partial [Bdellovibrionota bacterium]|nr:hypothetical protein [Bdellovibrionota bacterium]
LWGAAAVFRGWRATAKGFLALPALAALVFAFSISPQVYSCSAKFGKLCYQGPEINSAGAAQGLSMGMHGCRTYTMLYSKKHANSLITTYDQFYNQNFGDYCPIDPNRKIASIARCYADNFLVLPIFFGKKLVGLADNFHLNTYAAAITTRSQVAYNRVFGVLAFLGNLCCVALIARAVRRRQFDEPWFVPLGFYVSYLLLSIVFHVEGRFGFPMIPFALVALWLVLAHCTREGWSRHRGVASALLVAFLLFFVQVELWDLRDPLPYETPEEIDYQGESM